MHISSESTKHRRSPGRPREFDIDAAVDAALQLFRERGFHAASIAELSSAMGLTAGSIYKAFSDKRAIFVAAFDRYTTMRNARLQQLLEVEVTVFNKVRATLDFYAESSHGIEGRRGCLVVGGAAALATFDSEMAGRVTTALRHVETSLRNLVRLGQSDGSIPSRIDADACARVLACLLQGFRVIGKTGRTRAEMSAAVEQAMRLLA
ncbi:TetR/AcrR family transcriptional regulator [uncultured Caballeronia sp.]|uniref:TetR/AcrR family transcriptional regulator n=1 Tax=uncultured Caballeronia sp. TaxID=1827198 RepID=UPI0035CB65F8